MMGILCSGGKAKVCSGEMCDLKNESLDFNCQNTKKDLPEIGKVHETYWEGN